MNIDFRKLLAIAKKQTGYHYPDEQMLRNAFTMGEAGSELCKEVKAAQGLPPDKLVEADDKCHYLIEELVIDACITLYEERRQREQLHK